MQVAFAIDNIYGVICPGGELEGNAFAGKRRPYSSISLSKSRSSANRGGRCLRDGLRRNAVHLVRRPGINWTGRVPRFRPKSALICVYRRLMNCFREEIGRASCRERGEISV